jgi:DNA-binding transcriptional LysR family regulator
MAGFSLRRILFRGGPETAALLEAAPRSVRSRRCSFQCGDDTDVTVRSTVEHCGRRLPPRHRFASRKRVPLRELAHEPWISVGWGLVFDDVLRWLAIISGVNRRIVQRVNAFRVVEELVLAGVGIALVPRYALTARELVRKPLGGVQAARRIEAMTRAGAATRPAIAVVVDILKSIAQTIVDHDMRSS